MTKAVHIVLFCMSFSQYLCKMSSSEDTCLLTKAELKQLANEGNSTSIPDTCFNMNVLPFKRYNCRILAGVCQKLNYLSRTNDSIISTKHQTEIIGSNSDKIQKHIGKESPMEIYIMPSAVIDSPKRCGRNMSNPCRYCIFLYTILNLVISMLQ